MLARPTRKALPALIAFAILTTVAGIARAQAVAEPETPTEPEVPPPPPPSTSIFAIGRGSYRLPPASDGVGPALGLGIGVGGSHRYAHVWELLELGVALDLGYLRHSKEVTGVRTTPDGVEENFPSTRVIEDSQFVVMQTAGITIESQHRLWIGGGVGIAIGSFSTDEKSLRPGSERARRLLGRFAAGYEYDITDEVFAGARVDYSLMVLEPTYKCAGCTHESVFGDTFTFGLTVGSRFE